MALHSLKCHTPGCTYKTPELPESLCSQDMNNHTASIHANKDQSAHSNLPERTEKAKRPTISVGCTPEDWSFFEYAWKQCKISANIKDRIVANLMQCCEDTLHKDLFRLYGDPSGSTEEIVFNRIKNHAVHTENVIIARVTHQQMKQDRDEPVRNFVAKLKGQAGICGYTIEHECQCKLKSNVSYSDEMVRNILASGLSDNDIQRELFSDANQEMTLDQMINFIESKEAGKRSASQITSTVITSAVRSTYKRDVNQSIRNYSQHKRYEHANTKKRNKPCNWCGRLDHDYGSRNCPAFNHTCKNCGKINHYESVCKRPAAQQPRASTIFMAHDDQSSDPEVLMEAVHHRVLNQEK